MNFNNFYWMYDPKWSKNGPKWPKMTKYGQI